MDTGPEIDGGEMYDDNSGKGLMYLSFLLVAAYVICNFVLERFQ
jgi:hypothetical protein